MDVYLLVPPAAGQYVDFSAPEGFRALTLKSSGDLIVGFYDHKGSHWLFEEGLRLTHTELESLYVQVPDPVPEVLSVASFAVEMADGADPVSFDVGTFVTELLLDCDADRDGFVGRDEPGKDAWVWGRDGVGAIALVDNDLESYSGRSPRGLDERTPIIKRALPVDRLPEDVVLRLRCAPEAAMKCTVTTTDSDGRTRKLLGKLPDEDLSETVWLSAPLSPEEELFHLVAHEYPGPYFEGTLIFDLELVQQLPNGGEWLLADDRILLRVAPWIMIPHTEPVERVYTCEISGYWGDNSLFLEGLSRALQDEGISLEVVPAEQHRGDVWIQDELEIGYSRGPTGSLPVVFDSPRDRELDDYPEIALLGEDFGHFQIGGGRPNSLDSFGNLEVSPPITVRGKRYPMGRILFGGRRKGDFSNASRHMMPEVRQFLFAQKVQSPVELFTDWLAVGHVDEMLSFVPDPGSEKGFKLLLADTREVRRVLDELIRAGHGHSILFAGKEQADGSSAEITVQDLRSDQALWEGNDEYQSFLDENRDILMHELGLQDEDILSIPVCFKVRCHEGRLERATAYFPNMINHLVIGDLSIVPKPYGPLINGRCAFEEAFANTLRNRRVVFIDDWYSYHLGEGEVHCGTNTLRRPFRDTRWWHFKPGAGFDLRLTG